MTRQARTAWMLAVAILAGLCVTLPARGDATRALGVISADAEAVLIIRDLSALNRQIGELRQTLNLPITEMDDLVNQLRQHAGMTAGVDESGPVVVAMLNVSEALNDGRAPSLALLVPVSDYTAFVGNFDGDPAEAIAALRLPAGQQVYAKQLADHAVMSRDREVVDAYSAQNAGDELYDKLGDLGLHYLNESSLALYVDLDAIGPALLRAMDRWADQPIALPMADGLPVELPASVSVLRGVAIEGARAIVEGSQSMMVAVAFGARGAAVTTTLQMRDDSPLRTVFPGGASRTARELSKLPDQRFILAAAYDEESIALGRIAQAAVAAIPDPIMEAFPPGTREDADLFSTAQVYATALYVPDRSAIFSGDYLNAVEIFRVDDPEAYVAQWRASLEAMDAHERATAHYHENALRIEGVRVDQYDTRLEPPPAPRGQSGDAYTPPAEALTSSGYIAATDEHVVLLSTTDPQTMRSALRSLNEDAGIGTAGPIPALRPGALPPQPGVEAYVSLQGLAQLADMLSMTMPGPTLNVPPEVPPVMLGAGVQNDGVAFRIFMPAGAMKAVGEALVGPFAPMAGTPDARPARSRTPARSSAPARSSPTPSRSGPPPGLSDFEEHQWYMQNMEQTE